MDEIRKKGAEGHEVVLRSERRATSVNMLTGEQTFRERWTAKCSCGWGAQSTRRVPDDGGGTPTTLMLRVGAKADAHLEATSS